MAAKPCVLLCDVWLWRGLAGIQWKWRDWNDDIVVWWKWRYDDWSVAGWKWWLLRKWYLAIDYYKYCYYWLMALLLLLASHHRRVIPGNGGVFNDECNDVDSRNQWHHVWKYLTDDKRDQPSFVVAVMIMVMAWYPILKKCRLTWLGGGV